MGVEHQAIRPVQMSRVDGIIHARAMQWEGCSLYECRPISASVQISIGRAVGNVNQGGVPSTRTYRLDVHRRRGWMIQYAKTLVVQPIAVLAPDMPSVRIRQWFRGAQKRSGRCVIAIHQVRSERILPLDTAVVVVNENSPPGVVFGVISVRHAYLAQIGHALDGACVFLSRLKAWQQSGHEQRNQGNYYQEFDQGKGWQASVMRPVHITPHGFVLVISRASPGDGCWPPPARRLT